MRALIGFLATTALLAGPAFGQPASEPSPEAAYAQVRPMIADRQKIVTPNGVQSVEQIRLGGMDQWVSIRGADKSNPILIYVHGGPGAAEMGRAWPYQEAWEEFFTVVQWDQRGTGKTLRSNGAEATRPTLSRARMAEDLVELIAHLRQRFGQERVVLLGHSWGNAIAMDAAVKRPEWISAYVGVGPLIAMRANEASQYRQLLALAEQRGDAEALAELRAIAPYPGEGPLPFEKVNVVREWVMKYGGLAAYRDNADFYFRAARLSPDYDLADRQAIDEGGQLSVGTLLPEMTRIDLMTVKRVDFPVLMFLGRHDLTTPSDVAEAWMNGLTAPLKKIVWFEHSAHLAPHEEPGRFLMALVDEVRPLATGEPKAGKRRP
jgi:Predicted hydrolases or acyltransferases (alpha/beta hydrolase superfamily)